MTQVRKDSQKESASRKDAASSPTSQQQAELPLNLAKGDAAAQEKSTRSKLVFQLKSELNRLQQRDREWKLMFHMLSHDLKEPLLTLEGFSKLLDDPEVSPEDQKRYLKIVRESINSMHLLVGSLQSIAKLYSEPEDYTELSLNEVFHNVTVNLSEQIKKTRGEIRLPEKDLKVRAEPIRLFQIFLNLIGNSLKYHKNSVSPIIEVSYKTTPQNYRVAIRDNGVGIDEEDLQRIFVPFTRLEDVPTDGTGIGLSIVKRIAESFGGRVLVRSQQNLGTTFTVCLPRLSRSQRNKLDKRSKNATKEDSSL